eukprot:gene8412-5893_t
MTGYKRQRSTSAVEEKNVTSFVESCLNFESNVSFHAVKEGAALANSSHPIVLLGTKAELSDASKCSAVVPHLPPAILTAVKNASEGCTVAYKDDKHFVISAKISGEASRHNCPARPDEIYSHIRTALSMCTGGVLTVCHIGDQLPQTVAAAIAKASSRSFSAKSLAHEKSYLDEKKKVRVVLKSGNMKTIATTAKAIQICQRLVNAPTNLLDTTTFAEIASLWADKLKKEGKNVDCSIIMGEELREQGYGGLYGTGKAAEYPPHLVTLSYKPKTGINPQDKIAFVGKGIVYDTGGLSIKSRDGMCTMKHDMGGAAAIFGGFLALAMSDAPLEISCVLCLADNAIGPKAQRNDDIIIMKSGVSVEINNTDAEGRLVLSDGVFHASACLPYTPSTIVDMATLTGAQGIATGKFHAAIFSNSDESESLFVKAGKECGDLCFPVIYCPEFHNAEFSSEVADYKNSVKCRTNAQVSCAGQFIANNLSKDYKGKWVHVDLASPATRDQATGFGVALLVQAFAPQLF